MRTRVATVPDGLDPDEFLRSAGPDAGVRWEELAARAPSGFEAGLAEDSAALNPNNPNQMEMVASRIREYIAQFPSGLREGYAEIAERRTGISRHLLLIPVAPAAAGPAPRRAPETRAREGPGKYLVQLLAVRPDAFERIRDKVAPDELEPSDRSIYVRMLDSYDRAGAGGLEADLRDYPDEAQDVIRRAWAKPPPRVDDEVAQELAKRIRLNHMKQMENGIIRELTEAERDRDSETVMRMQTKLTQIGRAIADLEKEILTSLA
jgi:DNA primase